AAGSGGQTHVVSDVSRYSLPADPRTVAVVGKFLTEIALSTPGPVNEEVLGWTYPDAPPPRPVVDPGTHPEWAVLFDHACGTPAPTGPPAPIITPPAVRPGTTATRRP